MLVRVGWGAAQAAVGLSAALLLVYFLGTSAAGRAVMGWAVEQELYGVAEFGNVTADPAGAAVFVTDF